MVVSTRFAGSVAIIQLQGPLTLGAMLQRLKPAVEKTLDGKAATALVLNLAQVTEADSSGLGELVSIHTSAARRRVRLVLTNVNGRIRDLLETTRLDELFTVCADEPSALQHVAHAQVSNQPQ